MPTSGAGRPRRALRGLILFCGLALAGCQPGPPPPEPGDLPQQTSFYLDRPELHQAVAPAFQREQYARFLDLLRSPWDDGAALPSREEARADFRQLRGQGGYGENLRPRPDAWFEQMAFLSDLDAFPNAGFKAVTVAETDLRSLPTAGPVFDNPEGYPFDRLQQTRLAPGTPLLALHLSRDGAWALVQSHLAWGWVPRRDLARLRPDQLPPWRGDRFVAVIRDGSQVRDEAGHLLFLANVGAALPLLGQDADGLRVLAPVADDGGGAVLKQARLPADAAVAMPLPLSAANVARLAGQFLGQPYGWGGYLGNRDCSALVRDLYAPFGLWLPRNSRQQANQAGRFVPLAGQDKGETLLDQGLPFLSLIYMPGHIMLYAGQSSGRHVVLHALWGASSRQGQEQGDPVGRVVITPLAEDGSLMQRAEGLILLVP